MNQAAVLIYFADAKRLGSAGRLLGGLLDDDDAVIVDRALALVADFLGTVAPSRGSPGQRTATWQALGAEQALSNWLTAQPEDRIWSHLLALSRCMINGRWPGGIPEHDPVLLRWWCIALGGPHGRGAPWQSEGCGSNDEVPRLGDSIDERLRQLDGRVAQPTPGGGEGACSNWAAVELSRMVRNAVVGNLATRFSPARWSAGRILAVCRDERGLPAVYEWLRDDPKAPPGARKVIEALFGADWDKPFRLAAEP